ncbi:hypothetical protein CHS0354_034064 [Potamilus streckersoni]|uniref:Uncharacterized protein n=1 Tax=Potamilus streckersoni TaxID=2493646 RepID=A0AAE0VJG1_9BIVA|nr:hypothetical protein CHS0354_034064 [Potamilus streckersoni]
MTASPPSQQTSPRCIKTQHPTPHKHSTNQEVRILQGSSTAVLSKIQLHGLDNWTGSGTGAHQKCQTSKVSAKQPEYFLQRDPTTARHGDFCLLCFHPGPVRPSLDNLDPLGSPEGPILMPSLARTPDRHRAPRSRAPALKPSNDPGFQVAGLQEHATTPSR